MGLKYPMPLTYPSRAGEVRHRIFLKPRYKFNAILTVYQKHGISVLYYSYFIYLFIYFLLLLYIFFKLNKSDKL